MLIIEVYDKFNECYYTYFDIEKILEDKNGRNFVLCKKGDFKKEFSKTYYEYEVKQR